MKMGAQDTMTRSRLQTAGIKRKAHTDAGGSSELSRDGGKVAKTPKSKSPSTNISPSARTPREERRSRKFRKTAPSSYIEILSRATTQRMYVIERVSSGTAEVPEETIEMAGTTGNVYTVTIGLEPKCTCPHNRKGNQCKHIVYVLHNVLKAPENLQYQLAFLASELREIFSNAPISPSTLAAATSDDKLSSNRKEISGDCPICFTEFDREAEEIVFCRAACGNNVHRICFEQWAKSQRNNEVRCVYCRTKWQGDEESIKRISKDKSRINDEGYVNVAGELGLSGARDYATYHRPWVNQRLGTGGGW